MFGHIAGFELRYQLRSPVFWVGCLIFFLLTFGSITVDQIQIGGRGNVNLNSPYAILQTLAIMSLFAVFVIVALVANVVIRDDETGFAPILRATRMGRFDYLVGRFTGASAAAFLVLAMMPLGILAGSLMPWLDAERLGPFRPGDYLYALFCFALPTLLIVGATFFALATATRSLMWTYVGAVALLMLYFVMRTLLRDPQYDTLGALTDPFGLAALGVVTKYWTAAERNTQLPPLTGLMLANRVLWAGVALALFAFACWRFRFELTAGKGGRAKATRADAPRPTVHGPPAAPRADAATRWAQLVRLVRFDLRYVLRSPAFFVLLGIGMLNSIGGLWGAGRWYGGEVLPVTRLMATTLFGAFSIIPIIIAIFYAGELVWRDRERRLHEIVDATAAPDWTHLVPKILAITVALVATSLAAVAGGVLVQLIKGYTRFELLHYITWFLVPMTVVAVLMAALSVFVQVLVPHKFLGWGAMLVYLVASVALGAAGFEHNLYSYAGMPDVPLSDMNGAGRFWIGRAWYSVYWGAFALLLCVIAYALWPRGATVDLRPRLRQLPRRLRGAAAAIGALAVAGFVASGAWIYYNNDVLNRYLPEPTRDDELAALEKALLGYENVPQPKITAVTLDVQLYPDEPRASTRGTYVIKNRTEQPLAAMHLRWAERLRLDTMELAGATLERDFGRFNYRIYKLDPALRPGEERTLRFTTTLAERGFPNSRPLTRIVGNGTFLNNDEIAPRLGMSQDGLLTDRSKRRKRDLPAELRPPRLEDEGARAYNGLRRDSDWVDADITITAPAEQTPIAPGRTVSDTVRDGRRSVRFVTDAPINHFFSIQAARYAVQRDRWNDVDLAVYHHPAHASNVPRMLEAMKLSLAMFSERFSPYQFKQARIIEFPGYADFAQSFANTIPYSETIGFIFNHKDEEKIDVVTYVTAHEIAHQWWGHQLTPSGQQGATFLVESLAQYSALLVMEKMYGRELMRKFLKYELDRYLRSRGGELLEELPLARVENQPYIHYQKGSLAMYWLREAVGEAVVNRALAKLLEEFAFKAAPYPTARDFLRILRAEAGPQHDDLITDLFEKITLYDVKLVEAKSTKRADGRYDVALTVDGRKLYADGKGKEREARLDEPFDIGVFSAEPGKKGFTKDSVLLFERRAIQDGRQTLTVTVDKPPVWAGVDPYNKRIDRNSDDNLGRVQQ